MSLVANPPIEPPPAPAAASPIRRILLVTVALLTTALVWFVPTGAAPAAQHAVALAAGIVVLFMTEAVPPALSATVGLALFWVTGTSGLHDITAGVRNESTWLLVGALVFGQVATRNGLAQRLAYAIIARTDGSYSRLLLGLVVTDFVLTFFVPSGSARVAILAAVVVGLTQALNLGPRTPVARGLLIVVTYAAGIFDKMILAGAASILAHGIIEEVGGERISYARWFLAYLPCDLLTIVACWRIILWLFPDTTGVANGRDYARAALDRLGPLTGRQMRAGGLLVAAVAMWMTDAWHGIPPAQVALAVSVLALLPAVGVLAPRDLLGIRFVTVIFTAAVLGISASLRTSGGLDLLTAVLVPWLRPLATGPASTAAALYWTAFGYHFFLGSETAMLSATLPSVLNFAGQEGLSIAQVGLIWTFGAGGKIFAYQSPVLMVGYAYGFFDRADLIRVGLLLSVVEAAILVLLVPLYWPLIGL